MSSEFKLNTRIWFFAVYIVTILGINYFFIHDDITTSLWFWAAFLALLLGDLLLQPFFTSPQDAIGNSVAALSTTIPLISESVVQNNRDWWIFYSLGMGTVLFLSVLSIALGRSEKPNNRRIGESLTKTVAILGSPNFVFTLLYFLIIATFYSQVDKALLLTFLWVALVLGKPVETISNLIKRFQNIWQVRKTQVHIVGEVISRREPNILNIRISSRNIPTPESIILVPLDEEVAQICLVLDSYRLSSERWIRAVSIHDIGRKDSPKLWAPENIAMKCTENMFSTTLSENPIYKSKKSFIGSVVEKSDVSHVEIELYRDTCEIVEGQLLSIEIRSRPVLYQVFNAVTESEALRDSNRHGFMRIHARKLGEWVGKEHRFEQVPWTPNIHAPVYLVPEAQIEESITNYVGCIPKTKYGIKVNTKELVTHNTAILGVLGSGKTSLAVELILRILADGIKVWIIDITGEYQKALSEFIDIDKQNQSDQEIKQYILGDRDIPKDNMADGGNQKKFAEIMRTHINTFMGDQNWCIRIINPYQYDVTEQTSKIYAKQAGIGEMSAAQITRIISEQLLEHLKPNMVNQAKLCLVLEEAHSLIPEWSSVAYEGDKSASNGTAKAIMQGRKYGLGTLLVTQRTANVTKSILNQCNTIFGLQVFDATGMEFLGNYIGDDYAALLSTLPFRHCIAYGRGIAAKSPMIIELNDRDIFRNNFEIQRRCFDDDEGSASDEIPF